MKLRPTFLIFAFAALCGCSGDHFATGRGDPGGFILKQAIARGGSLVTTNALPRIVGGWRYSEDKDGVVILLAREQYPAVEAFLHEAFGELKMKPSQTSDGGKLGAYRLSSKGGAIQFGYNAKETHVIVLRPMSLLEFFTNLTQTTKIGMSR